MKVTIEFDGEEEKDELRTALDGSLWKTAMWDLDQKLRTITKNAWIDGREATHQELEAAHKLREELRGILENYNLNLY